MSLTLTAPQYAILNTTQSLPVLARWSLVFAVTVTTWDTRYRSRKHMCKLSALHLKDIGLDPLTAAAEARKPFWQA